MAKKKKIDIKQVIADALVHYHKMKPSIKDSTKRQNESLLSEFYRFVDTLPARDKTMKIFSQKGLNRYKEYLIDKMNSTKTDGKKRNFGVVQLNRCGSMIARLINKVLKPDEVVPNDVVWIKLEDPRREDQKGHIPLLDDEVAAIENCSGLSDVEEEYRDIFLLQIESGQRVSDLANILTGEYTVGQIDGYECIILETKKEDVPAAVALIPKVRMLLERIKTHKHVDPKEFKDKIEGNGNNTYNEAIRRIAKKAGLDRIIVKIDTNKIVEKKPLYEVITNHDARSTFITNKIRAGMTPDEIAVFTGHVNGEMIRRIYAQPTIEDKLRNVKQYLSGGKNEKDADSPSNTSSNQPNESAVNVHEGPLKLEESLIPITRDEDSQKQFNREDYIKGLSSVVDKALIEFKTSLSEHEQEVFNKTFNSLEKLIGLLYTEELNSKENVIECWHTIDTYFKEGRLIQEDDQMFNISRIHLLHYLIDYSIEHQIGKDCIKELEKQLREICEENFFDNIVYYTYRYPDIMLPIDGIQWAAISAMHYVLHNRPSADDYFMKVFSERENFASNLVPDWNVVISEFQKIPDIRLQAIIEKTTCPSGIRIQLYNSIVSGDINRFANTIHSYRDEVNVLIYYAYYINWIDTNVKSVDQGENHGGDQSFSEIGDSIQDVFWSYPFSNQPSIDVFFDYKEQRLDCLDKIFQIIVQLKKHAYSSEIKVFNKILNRMNQFPELKAAYEEYKARQNSQLDDENAGKTKPADVKKKKGKEEETIAVNYITFSTKNIDIDKLVRLLTNKDELNGHHAFVTLVKCDTSDADVTVCLKHFLDITTSKKPLTFKLKWNHKNKVGLKFLIRLLLNTNDEITRGEVIDEGAYDGISDKVSTGQGQGTFWPSVIETFDKCPKNIEVAGIGESKAKEINLKQLETIADIYFACRKELPKQK